MSLKFYTSVEEGLKIKVRKFKGAKSYVCRSYRGKTGRGEDLFDHPSTHLVLNKVKGKSANKKRVPNFTALILGELCYKLSYIFF